MSLTNLSELFKQKGLTLCSLESFTGGKFASEITSIPGASKFYKGAIVTYATEEKVNLLQIDQSRVDTYGVVSNEIALDMCTHGRVIMNTDVAVSFTGNAGPDAMEDKPVGLIYIGICTASIARVYCYQLKGSRSEIQAKAIEYASIHLETLLKEIAK